jgi:hypothetical protein
MNDPQQSTSPRRRMQELLAIPERMRTDEQWDELNELEISLAPVNRERPAQQHDQGGSRNKQQQGQGGRNKQQQQPQQAPRPAGDNNGGTQNRKPFRKPRKPQKPNPPPQQQ